MKKYIPLVAIFELFTCSMQAHELYIDELIPAQKPINFSSSPIKRSDVEEKNIDQSNNSYTKVFYEMTSQDILFSIYYVQNSPQFMFINEELLNKLSSVYENDFLPVLSKKASYASTQYFKDSVIEIETKMQDCYQYLWGLCQKDVVTPAIANLFIDKLIDTCSRINNRLKRLKVEFGLKTILLSDFKINKIKRNSAINKSSPRTSFKRKESLRDQKIDNLHFVKEENIPSIMN